MLSKVKLFVYHSLRFCSIYTFFVTCFNLHQQQKLADSSDTKEQATSSDFPVG